MLTFRFTIKNSLLLLHKENGDKIKCYVPKFEHPNTLANENATKESCGIPIESAYKLLKHIE